MTRYLFIKGEKIVTQQDLYRVIADKLSFPAYFGNNLDALFDLLTEVSIETYLTLTGTKQLKRQLGRDWYKIKDTLLQACQFNNKLYIDMK